MQNIEKSTLMSRTALITLIALLIILFAALFVNTFSIFLLLFGGILLSELFQGISNRLHRWTKWPRGVTLTCAFLLVLAFISGITFLIGNTVAQQYDQFAKAIPQITKDVNSYVEKQSWGDKVKDMMPSGDENGDQIAKQAGSFFKSTFGVFGDLYAIIFLGIFIMISPQQYVKGTIALFPAKYKSKAENVIVKMGNDLKVWLKAQMLEMLFTFTLTAIGAVILGADLWIILAIIGGTLTFIPNIGPTIALIPAILIGLMDGPEMAMLLVGLFLLVQLLESAVFGPFVRQKMLSLPPALVLFFQLLMGALAGAWGILFATPLLVVIIIFVNEVYIKGTLEESPDLD